MKSRMMGRTFLLFGAIALVGASAQTAFAQRPGGGQRLSPEDAREVWGAQAGQVAHQLALSNADGQKLTKAFVESRKSFAMAMREARENGGQPSEGQRGDFRERRRIQTERTQAERAKLQSVLEAFLNDEQSKTAADLLGSFDGQWDRLVHAVLGYHLGKKENAAVGHINSFIVARVNLFTPGSSADGRPPREEMQRLQSTLNNAMQPLLTEAQFGQWKEVSQPRRGRGGQGGGGGRPPRGGPPA